ncbi:MAG: YraN family protein [Planctomycetes bacterium]|nr:YraN family protein [Planctomycetota bacterium]
MFVPKQAPPRAPSSPAPASPKTPQRARGDAGEDAAARYAQARGWPLVARNHRCKRGEIDLIVRDGQTLVFVEVKTRAAPGRGLQAVTWSKRRRLVLASLHYAGHHRVDLSATPCRFDVCEVWVGPQGKHQVRWHERAFDAEGLGLDL